MLGIDCNKEQKRAYIYRAPEEKSLNRKEHTYTGHLKKKVILVCSNPATYDHHATVSVYVICEQTANMKQLITLKHINPYKQ